MKRILLFGGVALLAVAIGCNSSGGEIVIDTDGRGQGGGTIGQGVDPGKLAQGCYPAFADTELNVVTWNIEWFPKNDAVTFNKVQDIIDDLDADLIAVQEIEGTSQFMALGQSVQGWGAAFVDVKGEQETGFLYKEAAFLEFGVPYIVSELSAQSPFPREAIRVDATYASGLEVTFINIHLKCCGSNGGTEWSRRKDASERMKAYIDQNLSNKAVIVLGDFNDEISSTNSPFQNFKNDASNYRFADMTIATGSSSNWSYPSWPSHLDHILITDELFDYLGNVQTVKPESCVSNYYNDVSDHRPVLASFGSD